MKKILTSLFTVGVIATLAVVATQAFFSDSETSTGNKFVAGDIDLKIDNSSFVIDYLTDDPAPSGKVVASTATSWDLRDLTVEKFFDFSDLKPGDFGEDTISVHVGSNDAYMCAAARITADDDVTCTDPEKADDANCAEPGLGQGELDQEVKFAFWIDDGDNVLESDEHVFLDGPVSSLSGAGKISLADSAGSVLGGGPVPGDTTFHIGKYWCFGDMLQTPIAQGNNQSPAERNATGFSCSGVSVDNASQTDMLVADLEFYAVQSRNNAGFLCSSWTPSFPVQLPKVGANLDTYSVPNCTTTVSANIQGAVNDASSGATICVNNGIYNETVTINKPLTLASVNGPTNTATIQGGVKIESDNVKVTGFIVNPGSILGSNAAFYLNGSLSNVEISFNDIDGNNEASSRGVETTLPGTSTYSNVVITNNLIHELTTGIYTNTHVGTLEVKYNDIYDNSAGIGGYTGAHVAYNHFTSSGEAIGADSSYNGSVVEFNNFMTGTKVMTYGSVTPDISAPNNYWADGSAIHIGGTNDVDPNPVSGSQYPHN
ncbi:hypothetical protein IPM62_03760 [Candidatus Woesebacteria bacterium]|nr:MAG: hypothetical protein IPM62_03760 [Candidatus Woesebacteria bacterium]